MATSFALPHAPIAARGCRPEVGLRRGPAECAGAARRGAEACGPPPAARPQFVGGMRAKGSDACGSSGTEEGAYPGRRTCTPPYKPGHCLLPPPHDTVCASPGLGGAQGEEQEEGTWVEALPKE